MQWSVPQPSLSRALKLIGAVVSRDHDQLSGRVLLEAKDSRLKLTCVDLDIGLSIVAWLDAKIGAEGDILLPGYLFKKAVDTFEEERIDANLDRVHMRLDLRCGEKQTGIECYNRVASDYPCVYETGPVGPLLKGGDLLEAVQRTFSVVKGKANRPGLRFAFEGNCLTLTMADKVYRASARIALDANNLSGSYTVPAKSMEVLKKVLADNPGVDVAVSLVEDHHLLFSVGNVVVAAQLLEGKFLEVGLT